MKRELEQIEEREEQIGKSKRKREKKKKKKREREKERKRAIRRWGGEGKR